MSKMSTLNRDEIDLIALIKVIWNKKKIVALISIIIFLIGCGYSYRLQATFSNTLEIKPSDNFEFTELNYIFEEFNIDTLEQTNNTKLTERLIIKNDSDLLNELFFKKFYKELTDYEELIIALKDTTKFENEFSDLSLNDQKKELFKNANLLTVYENKKKDSIDLELIWYNEDEGIEILEKMLNLTLENLSNKIFNTLETELEIIRRKIEDADLQRLIYLKEQTLIAKELGFSDTQADSIKLSQPSVSLNINTSDVAYYLRGYKAIDKEIELIKNRNYENLTTIQNEIDKVKNSNINWVKYNIFLTKTKLLKNTKLILTISGVLGLFLGIIFVAVLNLFSNSNLQKKNKIK